MEKRIKIRQKKKEVKEETEVNNKKEEIGKGKAENGNEKE
jgi:hypothetical protein